MEYVIIVILQLLGIGFNVVQEVRKLDLKHPEKSIKDIYGLFFDNEWSSLSISILVLILDVLVHAILDHYFPSVRDMSFTVPFTTIQIPFVIMSFGIALALGYAGQRIAYKYLGKMEDHLTPKE